MSLYPLNTFPADRLAAIDDQGQVLSYGELAQLARQLAEKISTRNVALVLVRNTLGSIAAIVALIESGVVPILLDANIDDTIVKRYLNLYQPEILAIPSEKHSQYAEKHSLLSAFDYVIIDNCIDSRHPKPHPDLALLLSTSGSTGNPKLVRQSRANLISNAESIVQFLGLQSSDRPIINLPLHYTYGFSILNSHLQVGATMLVTDLSVLDKHFWEFFEKEEGSSLAGVPYTYQMLKRLGFLKKPPSKLRKLTQAGGKLNIELIREFAEFAIQAGIEFFVMYGQVEATARISYVPASHALKKAGSIGIAIPGGELFLVDDQGNRINKTGVIGQLGYRGSNVAMGYAENRADLAKSNEWNESLLTGDLGRCDEDGYYYITGRLNRMVKIFGKRLNLDDLEQICLDVVSEVACIGVDDLVTFYVTESKQAAALSGYLAEKTGIHRSAYQVRVIESLPRLFSGKIDYPALLREEVVS